MPEDFFESDIEEMDSFTESDIDQSFWEKTGLQTPAIEHPDITYIPELRPDVTQVTPKVTKKVARRPKKAIKRVTKPTEAQVFKPQLPPDIFADIQKARFKGTPTEGRETAARRPTKLAAMMAETPEEAAETKRIQHEQELYDTYGPAIYYARKGASRLIGQTLAPLTSIPLHVKQGYEDIKDLVTGEAFTTDVAEIQRKQAERQKAEAELLRGPFDPKESDLIVHGGEHYGEKAIAPLIEYGGMALPFVGKPRPRGIPATEPFRGGARVGVKPPIRPQKPPQARKLLGPGEIPPTAEAGIPVVEGPTGYRPSPTASAYGEAMGPVKVGKRGRKPKPAQLLLSQSAIEGGAAYPISEDMPTLSPITESMVEKRPPIAEVLAGTDPATGLPLGGPSDDILPPRRVPKDVTQVTPDITDPTMPKLQGVIIKPRDISSFEVRDITDKSPRGRLAAGTTVGPRVPVGEVIPIEDQLLEAVNYPKGWRIEDVGLTVPIEDTLAFDVMPALRAGQAPYLRLPSWAMTAMSRYGVYGQNIPIQRLETIIANIRAAAPDMQHADLAEASLRDLAEQSQTEGIKTLSFASTIGEEPEIRGRIEHETFHAAQLEAGMPGRKWVSSHPTIRKMMKGDFMNREFLFPGASDEQVAERLAIEIPTYTIQGKAELLGLTQSEGMVFLRDFYEHIAQIYGLKGLETLRGVSRLQPEIEEALNLAEQLWKRPMDREDWEITQSNIAPFMSGIEIPDMLNMAELSLGDQVKSKSIGKLGQITKLGTDDDGPWAEVTFNDGTIEELTQADLQINNVTQKVTKASGTGKLVPTLPGPMRIKKGLVQVNKIGPGDEPGKVVVEFASGTRTQFGIDDVRDSRGRRIKDPALYMLSQNPPIIGGPPSKGNDITVAQLPSGIREPLFSLTITPEVYERITKKFSMLLASNKITYDFTIGPMIQVRNALIDGTLRDADVEIILKEEGLEWEDFSEAIHSTGSQAGSVLQDLSEINRTQWLRLMAENPTLATKLFTPKQQIDMILEDLQNSVVGRTLWERSGSLVQKMVLTQLSTFAINSGTTLVRLPLDVASSGLGAWMQQAAEGKGNFKDVLGRANEAAKTTMLATWEVARALNPRQLNDLIVQGKPGKEYAEHIAVISQLETFFPDIHRKLFAKPLESIDIQGMDVESKLADANLLLPKIKNKAKRRELLDSIKRYEKRLEAVKSVGGKAISGSEFVYDILLKPMQAAEFLFRRPMFVGWLRLELLDRGIKLDDVLRNTQLTPEELAAISPEDQMTFQKIPRDAIKGALDRALELTYAYDPKNEPDVDMIERAAFHFIKGMNKLGPLSYFVELFPRAAYNGMKAMYEYSPLPIFTGLYQLGAPQFLLPEKKSALYNIIKGEEHYDPVAKETYKKRPIRPDWEKLARAMLGTVMLFISFDLIQKKIVGSEWWQLLTGKKTKDGRPTYIDARRWRPFAEHLHLASILDRYAKGTMNDKELANEILSIYTGIRRTPEGMETLDLINSVTDYWGGDISVSEGRMNIAKEALGKTIAIPLTPLLNVRSTYAQFSEEENRRKDLRDAGIFGPALDRIPWLRQSLPDLTSPVEPGPLKISESPMIAQFAGVQTTAAPNFAGREWQRMGIDVTKFLKKDPHPGVNREQNKLFEFLINMVGEGFAQDPNYADASNDVKMMKWEQVVGGDSGLASAAHMTALDSHPEEKAQREIIRGIPGRFTRRVLGVDKLFEKEHGMRIAPEARALDPLYPRLAPEEEELLRRKP